MITFNGVNSDSLGLYVEKYPARSVPERKQTVYQIHGRSGDLIVSENAYKNLPQEYEVFILGGAAGFQAKAKAVAKWLLSPEGYARLTDSYDPNVYRKARFVGGIPFLNSLNKFGRATITFDCCPQRYPIPAEELTGNIGSTFTLPNSDMQDGLPLIDIQNLAPGYDVIVETSDITISIDRVSATEAHVYVDWETHSVFNGLGDRLPATIVGNWTPQGSGDTIHVYEGNGATPTMPVKVSTRRYYL